MATPIDSALADVISRVQRELGALVTRPKLTEKLLSKPPYRFLVDVVAAVVSNSNWGADVFTKADLDTSVEIEKQQKAAFLTKLIAAVEASVGARVDALATAAKSADAKHGPRAAAPGDVTDTPRRSAAAAAEREQTNPSRATASRTSTPTTTTRPTSASLGPPPGPVAVTETVVTTSASPAEGVSSSASWGRGAEGPSTVAPTPAKPGTPASNEPSSTPTRSPAATVPSAVPISASATGATTASRRVTATNGQSSVTGSGGGKPGVARPGSSAASRVPRGVLPRADSKGAGIANGASAPKAVSVAPHGTAPSTVATPRATPSESNVPAGKLTVPGDAVISAASKASGVGVSSSGGGGVRFSSPVDLGANGEVATTIALLQPLITRPTLSEKHLARPPFRFLHDIVLAVVEATGWGRGLLVGAEAMSGGIQMQDREGKRALLQKLIDTVGVFLFTHVSATPADIAAGKECERTNELLQLLAIAASSGRASDAAVARVLAGERQPALDGTRVTPVAITAALEARSRANENAPALNGEAAGDAGSQDVSAAVSASQPNDGTASPSLQLSASGMPDRATIAAESAAAIAASRALRPSTATRRLPPSRSLAASHRLGQGGAGLQAAAGSVEIAPRVGSDAATPAPAPSASRTWLAEASDAEGDAAASTALEDAALVQNGATADSTPGGSASALVTAGVNARGKHVRDILGGNGASAANAMLAVAAAVAGTSPLSADAALASDIQALCATGAAAAAALDYLPEDVTDARAEMTALREQLRLTGVALRTERAETARVLGATAAELEAAKAKYSQALARVASLRAAAAAADERVASVLFAAARGVTDSEQVGGGQFALPSAARYGLA